MWTWLKNNPDKLKEDFLEENPNFPQNLENDCPCCEYAMRETGRPYNYCGACPIKWPQLFKMHLNQCLSSYYLEYEFSDLAVTRKKAAEEILKLVKKIKT